MDNPLVSILLPVSKLDEFLAKSINSLLQQSLTNFELIVIANGRDHVEIMNYVNSNFNDDRIILHDLQLGSLCFALNYAFNISRGEFIARMDADDISLPYRLERQVDFLRKNLDFGVVGSRISLIDHKDLILKDRFLFLEQDRYIKFFLPIINTLCHPAIMFRRECLLEAGFYRYGYMSEDHELFLRISCNTNWKFYNLNEILFYYRRHKNQITTLNNTWKNFTEITPFLIHYFLKTLNPLYFVGIFFISPPVVFFKRKLRKVIRNL